MNDVGRILDSLKPCPFCGGKAGRRFRAESLETPFECIIECADCGASLRVIDTANDLKITQNLAIDKWNTRIEGACLLKEQEPVKPTKLLNEKVVSYKNVVYQYSCGNCSTLLRNSWKVCPLCGKEVKWDDD